MILYKNTFINIMTEGFDFPIEDWYYANNREAIVVDGITRDPIGITDFSKCSKEEFIRKYPRPSGSELAFKLICKTFSLVSGSLKDRLIECNKKIKELNKKYNPKCDYLENDYYGSVASCARIVGNTLEYAYICDCGIVVYDKKGNIKFKTENDKEIYSDPYINQNITSWNFPEARKLVRSHFRNNIDNIIDGVCVSYGALTGEKKAIHFIKSGKINITDDDTIIVYSDGLVNYLDDDVFIKQVLNFNKEEFEEYINSKAFEDYEKYGKERTIVILKTGDN